MAHSTQYLTYYIVLTDPARVAALQAEFPFGYQFAPYNPVGPGGAAVAFSAPWAGSSPGTDPGNYQGPAPYTWSPEWTAANNYDQSVATFERHSGGFWGIGGDTVRFYWVGQFTLASPVVPTVGTVPPISPANLSARRFINGFETLTLGAWSDADRSGFQYSRDAARHVGGMGLAIRGILATTGTVPLSVYTPSGFVNKTSSWERFYIRIRAADPTQTIRFWNTSGGVVSAANGVQLAVAPSGAIVAFNSAGGVFTLLGTTAPLPAWDGTSAMDAWHRLDMLIEHNTGGGSGRLRVFVDGVVSIDATVLAAAGGLGVNTETHGASQFGANGSPANTLSIDIDDWANYDRPTVFTGADWLSGSRIVLARPKAFGTNHNAVAWPGAVQTLMQNGRQGSSTASSGLTSSTASSICEVDLDTDVSVDTVPGKIGVAAFVVSATPGLEANIKVGYRSNGGGAVDVALAVPTPSGIMLSATGAPTFTDVTPIAARFVKAATATPITLASLQAEVEVCGIFGACDYRATEGPPPAFPRYMGQHNAPYPRSTWARDPLSAPTSPVIIQSGTYVGNNVGQDIAVFRAPVHLFLVRPVTAGAGGFQWWSTMQASHRGGGQGIVPSISCVDEDTTFVPGIGETQQKRYRVRVNGADNQINATGVTYQYVAFMDPGGRFCLNGQFSRKIAFGASSEKLIDAAFTPEFAFLMREDGGTGTGSQWLVKGSQNAADAISFFTTTTALTAALTFAAGQLQLGDNLFSLGKLLPYCLFRKHDGNNDPGEPGVVAFINWTGDGTASRTIGITPTSGTRPIFCLVAADNAGTGYYRDPSHTGSNSMTSAGADGATGITGGGIDSISVGSALNVNAVNYCGIVFFGDTTAGNGGFGVNGEYIPVQADRPADGPWPPTPDPSVFVPIVPPPAPLEGEPDLEDFTVLSDVDTDLGGLVGGQTCEFYTRHAANMALSRIGSSKRIVSLSNDNTQEATLARSHVLEDTNQVLRDFDWPFATRYANLVLVAGTATVPVNGDWQYSYRAPNAMMKARRIVNQDGVQRGYDPNPPKFRVGSDAVGPVIYTNEVATTAVPLVLEYTIRNLCPAFYGDALFRDALAWKFAFSLAPVLSKDPKRQEFCGAMYERAIGRAMVPAAQESQQAPPGEAAWITDRN